MIHHWKALDLEITDSEYQHDPTSSCEIIPSQTLFMFYVDINLLCERSESKKSKLEELSNNISKRRVSKTKEPVRER